MTTVDPIADRRCIRKYKTDPIPRDVLERVLMAARIAPSAHNYQPWKIIVVTSEETKKALASNSTVRFVDKGRSWQSRLPWVGELFGNAPVVLVGCGDERESIIRHQRQTETVICGRWTSYLMEPGDEDAHYESSVPWDVAIAFDHISLAARQEGLGSCWIAAFNDKEVRRILSIPDHIRVELMMTLGYPEAWPGPRPREPLDELICYERYRA